MQIYLARNNQQAGPYSVEELNQMLASQQVLLTDLAWYQGMTEWKALGELTQGKLVFEPIHNPPVSNPHEANPTIQSLKVEKKTQVSVTPASVGKRISAKLIDFLLLLIPQMCAIIYYLPADAYKIAESGYSAENQTKVTEMLTQSMPVYVSTGLLVYLFALLIVQYFLISKTGQSIGKKIFKLQIVDVETNQLAGSLRAFFVRTFLFLLISQLTSIIPLLVIVFIVDFVMFLSKPHYALHDRISKTKVIDISK
ncbi:RDD family protein [Acinetobacter wuhouensis]|uniref:RDD family protein n=1 Tax=Acinetobacter wuhouensis TaxID=1879050 RepID=UPI00083B29F1|nr:RDD family protein [Acinetobacter wuhouensis]AXQ22798.1 RDD family protein [Acinetobacter wuhouensis]